MYAGLKGTDIRDIREIPLEEAGLIVDEARERTLLNEALVFFTALQDHTALLLCQRPLSHKLKCQYSYFCTTKVQIMTRLPSTKVQKLYFCTRKLSTLVLAKQVSVFVGL